MRLDRIIRNSGCTVTAGDIYTEIDAVCNDSRKSQEAVYLSQ